MFTFDLKIYVYGWRLFLAVTLQLALVHILVAMCVAFCNKLLLEA